MESQLDMLVRELYRTAGAPWSDFNEDNQTEEGKKVRWLVEPNFNI